MDRFPLANETFCVTNTSLLKQAALLFDRVYCPPNQIEHYNIPKEIIFYSFQGEVVTKKLVIEAWYRMVSHLENTEDKKAIDRLSEDEFLHKMTSEFKNLSEKQNNVREIINNIYIKKISEGYSQVGFYVTPVFSSQIACDTVFPPGDSRTYQAVFNNLPLVSNDISWEQVLEFRKDSIACGHYRELRIWLNDALKTKSVTEATDIIGQRIDKYEWAIKKHGLETLTGSLKILLDSKYVAAITTGAGIAGLVGGPIWALVAGGSLALGKVAIWISERLIELEDIKRSRYSEVALIYEIKRKFGSEKS